MAGTAEQLITDPWEEVTLPDPNLEAVIREKIDRPEGPIYVYHLMPLSVLDASHRDIIDLTGLEYCTNLTALDLNDNQISDISALANLTNLEVLVLDRNEISDVSPLSNLTDLEVLVLGYNEISDIWPLVQNRGLSDGDTVNLRDNPLSIFSIRVSILLLQLRGVEVRF